MANTRRVGTMAIIEGNRGHLSILGNNTTDRPLIREHLTAPIMGPRRDRRTIIQEAVGEVVKVRMGKLILL